MRLTSPDGARSVVAQAGFAARFDGGGATLMQVIYPAPLPGAMPMVLVAVAPTTAADDAPIAPSGVWRIEIGNVGPREVDVHAWIQRDDTAPGFVLAGRQSYFDDPAYVRHRRGGTRGGDRLASQLREARGHVECDRFRHAYACRGRPAAATRTARRRTPAKARAFPSATGTRRLGPDAFAVSDRSAVHKGVLAAGTRTGSVYAMNGTSVAAPQVTRLIADLMARGRWPRTGAAHDDTALATSGTSASGAAALRQRLAELLPRRCAPPLAGCRQRLHQVAGMRGMPAAPRAPRAATGRSTPAAATTSSAG